MTMVNAEVTLQLADEAEAGEPPPSEADFTDWVLAVADFVDRDLEVTIRLVTEVESRALNHQYRGRDKPTNVLSFPFEPPPGFPADSPFVGDLAICSAVVSREALTQNKAQQDHWAHMAMHGTLHLLGYDHQNDDDAEVMEAIETQLLSQHHIPDPYRTAGDTEQQ